jgi:hypothetical protein
MMDARQQKELTRLKDKVQSQEPLTDAEKAYIDDFLNHDPLFQHVLRMMIARGDAWVNDKGEVEFDPHVEERLAAGMYWD